jgi:hypothetical protein
LLFGTFALGIAFFTKTNFLILCLVLVVWGLSQVSFAIFFQVFIKKAKTASSIDFM